MSRSTGLDHFVRLNQAVYLHQPEDTPASSKATSNHDPDLILLVGWMDASPRHLSKYASKYEKLYPSSRILVITTNSLDTIIRSKASNLQRIKPALEVLYSLSANPHAKVLLHFFSNGGGFTSNLMANAYREKMGKVLPVSGMILDSTPGRARHEATVRAFAVGMPKNIILRFIGVFLFRILLVLWRLSDVLRTKPNVIDKLRLDLNDATKFNVDTPRMYIYSEKDDMVEWTDVEDHIEDAKGKGYKVEAEKYKESGHAAHMVFDPTRYWLAVERLWESAR